MNVFRNLNTLKQAKEFELTVNVAKIGYMLFRRARVVDSSDTLAHNTSVTATNNILLGVNKLTKRGGGRIIFIRT